MSMNPRTMRPKVSSSATYSSNVSLLTESGNKIVTESGNKIVKE